MSTSVHCMALCSLGTPLVTWRHRDGSASAPPSLIALGPHPAVSSDHEAERGDADPVGGERAAPALGQARYRQLELVPDPGGGVIAPWVTATT